MDLSYLTSTIEQNALLRHELFGNSLLDYSVALGLFLLYLIVFYFLQKFILSRFLSFAARTHTRLDDMFVRLVDTIHPPFYFFIAFYFASRYLELTQFWQEVLDVVLIVWVVYQVVLAVTVFLDYVLELKFKPEEKNAESAVNLIKTGVKLIIWLFGLLFLLSNLGINITTLIAGLGVGGIAIAFALQNILGDLFSSLAIFLDKPFKEGDFIVVGNKSGTVEKIGIKTSRIRSLEGEEIVFANQELTSSQIQNYKKLQRRRVLFDIGVTYHTPQKQMKQIPIMVEKIIKSVEDVTFDRAHFKAFGDSALLFEIVYHVEKSEYGTYMDRQQEILFEIKDAFEKKSIEIAYPTQTVYIQK